ncbi:MAG TPA: hypothetical protein VHE35_34300, partial [Kofleriaceae bacterium]|nr:hypothetical protein [Kofleriaceae bacterium]
ARGSEPAAKAAPAGALDGGAAVGGGAGSSSSSAAATDAATSTVTVTPSPPAGATAGAPAGMVLVKKDGKPWFYVDARPVSAGEYATIFPKTKQPPPALAAEPVRSVPYAFARAYADITHKRLLTSDEWDAAIQTTGVIAHPNLFEWIAPAVGAEAPVRAPGKSATRPLTAQKDVTFRLALDPGDVPR